MEEKTDKIVLSDEETQAIVDEMQTEHEQYLIKQHDEQEKDAMAQAMNKQEELIILNSHYAILQWIKWAHNKKEELYTTKKYPELQYNNKEEIILAINQLQESII